MLSRTADHLFWMARHSERAENLARLLDVTYQMSLVPQAADAAQQNWKAVLVLNSLAEAFAARHSETTAEHVLHFMIRDETNPSSLFCSLRSARENAHAVRGTLTAEMWETINSTWIELHGMRFDDILGRGIGEFFDWVKERASLFRGAAFGTMLQDEAFQFIRLGGLLERADNTARILDVKYHGLAPVEDESRVTDFYRWGALLRSLSAFEVYRKVYRDLITPARVAELLILREDLPRSLHFCLKNVTAILERVANAHSAETEAHAVLLYASLRCGRMDEIFARGLHAYLEDFMDRVYDLGNRISQDFLISE